MHQSDLGPRNASGFIFRTLKVSFVSQEFWARKSPDLVTHEECKCNGAATAVRSTGEGGETETHPHTPGE